MSEAIERCETCRHYSHARWHLAGTGICKWAEHQGVPTPFWDLGELVCATDGEGCEAWEAKLTEEAEA